MNELDKILKIVEQAPDEFESKIPDIEKKIFKDVSLLLKDLKVSGNGKIETSIENLKLINEIKAKLGKIVVSKEYSNLVNKFVENIPAISNFQTSTSGITGESKKMMSAVARQQIENTLDGLIGDGYKQEIAGKIYNLLLISINSGGNYSDLLETLRAQLVSTDDKTGMLAKYTGQYVNNSLSQFDGYVGKMVADMKGYEWFRYSGSNITTTREFCKHMTQKDYFHISEIPEILKGHIDGHECKIYEKTGLPMGMVEGTNESNFFVYRGGYYGDQMGCRHRINGVPTESVPLEVRERIENSAALERSLSKLQDLSAKSNSGVLYDDITGGIATKLIKVINGKLDNREKIKILKEVIENKGFNVLSKNTGKGTVTKVFETVNDTYSEYNDNKNAAQALNNNGYDVYMLPKLHNSKSPDYVIAKNDKVHLAELKTIYGTNSLGNRLNAANEQSDRVVINIVGNITARNVAGEIKAFYLENPHIKEIIVLKGGKLISVNYKYINRKNFKKIFMDEWAR